MQINISANYRNRKSPKKWFVRMDCESPDEAVEAHHVSARNVTLQCSQAVERDLGCNLVGVTHDNVTILVGDKPCFNLSGMTKCRFFGGCIVTDDTGKKPVTFAKRLVLTGTSIYAEL